MYEVGQVIYTISEKNQKVIPLKIIEQVITKKLDGELTEYTVSLPSNKEDVKYNLKKFKKIYQTLEEIKAEMVLNANQAIDKMIEEGSRLEEEYFSPIIKEVIKKDEEKIIEEKNKDKKDYKNKQEDVKIDLGNGQTAKINLTSIKEKLGK